MRNNNLRCHRGHPVIAFACHLGSQAPTHCGRSDYCQRAALRRLFPRRGQANSGRVLHKREHGRRIGGQQYFEDRPLERRVKTADDYLARLDLLQRPFHRRPDGGTRTLARGKKRCHRRGEQGLVADAAEQCVTALDFPRNGGLDNNGSDKWLL